MPDERPPKGPFAFLAAGRHSRPNLEPSDCATPSAAHRERKPAEQLAGIREADDQVWQVSFLQYDLGYFDRDQDRVEPGPNPFAPDTVLTMCPE